MKTFILFLILILSAQFANAQVIQFTDSSFKNKLLLADNTNQIAQNGNGDWVKIDTNNDGEIQLSEAAFITYLDVTFSQIRNLTGIKGFVNLKWLNCSGNNFQLLDVSSMSELEHLRCNNSFLLQVNIEQCDKLEYLNISSNQISQLDLSGNQQIKILECAFNSIDSLKVHDCSNLTRLNCFNNKLTSLDLSGCFNLSTFDCASNNIIELKVSDCKKLKTLECHNNKIKELNLENFDSLHGLNCNDNELVSLDLSSCTNLAIVYCGNEKLEILNLKNGKSPDLLHAFFSTSKALKYICCDESMIEEFQNRLVQWGIQQCLVNTYCSFMPGGNKFNTLTGHVRFSDFGDTCNSESVLLSHQVLEIQGDSISNDFILSNTNGQFVSYLHSGEFTIKPINDGHSANIFYPEIAHIYFKDTIMNYVQDFCLLNKDSIFDAEINIVPINGAIPGFDAIYEIAYSNNGNSILTGNIELIYDSTFVRFISASIPPKSHESNRIVWDYADLKPGVQSQIRVTFNTNKPTDTPPLNSGDILIYKAEINHVFDDNTPDNNKFILKQTVVNSYDPNDKTCLEGEFISPQYIGKYVHYLIRFENLGTASAVNVVINDMIDTGLFDFNSIRPVTASHDFATKLSNSNQVEFIFENIELPGMPSELRHGFVLFKIKTKSHLKVGDRLKNQAEIYFDYNWPIITNESESQILYTPKQISAFNGITIFPNPAYDILYIKSENIIKYIEVLDINGRLLKSETGNQTEIRLNHFIPGIYFLKTYFNDSVHVTKFIKE